MKTALAMISVVLLPVICWSEGKIYTDEDLEKYQRKKIQVAPVNPEKQNKDVGERRILDIKRNPLVEENRELVNREINLYLAECPTYQSLFSSSGNVGGGTVRVMSRGRSLEEICDSIGRGCRVCREVGY